MLDNIPTISDGILRLSGRRLPMPNILRSNEPQYHQEADGKQSTFFSQSVRKKNRAVCNIFVLGLAELVGTALLLFLGCMGCVSGIDIVPVPHHLSGIIFGLTVLLIIQLFGHISGAHLNPAVTLSSALQGHLRPLLVPIYIAAQFLGAFLGFGLLKVLIPEDLNDEGNSNGNGSTTAKPGLCSTTLHPKLSSMQALAIEVIITTVLIMICCSVWDKRNAKNTDSTSVRFGLIISVISMVAGPFTGASMNTVRSFAPAVFNGDWDSHWVYWVGPTLGALIGTFSYKFVFEPTEEDDDDNEDKLNNTEDIPLQESRSRKKNNIV